MSAPARLGRAELGPATVWYSGRSHGNVGDHVGDERAAVARRRAAIAAAAGLTDPSGWVWLRQVHGASVIVVGGPDGADGADGAAGSDEGVGPPPAADAAVTAKRGLPLAIVSADCASVVLASERAVGIVHAGHRGLLAGVIETTVDRLRTLDAAPIRAFLGPCIRPGRYEFGVADLAAAVSRLGPTVEGRTDDGQPALDLPAGVRAALTRVGVTELDDCGICTASSDAFFSHRRDGATGRQCTVVVLR